MLIISVLNGCSKNPLPQENYVGKTRKEIVNLCASYERVTYDGKSNQIVIVVDDCAWKYYNSVEDILNDKYVMNAKEWWINFKEGTKGIRGGTYFYRITFENDIVVKQEKKFSGDAF